MHASLFIINKYMFILKPLLERYSSIRNVITVSVYDYRSKRRTAVIKSHTDLLDLLFDGKNFTIKIWARELVLEKVGAKARVKEDVGMVVDKEIGITGFAEAALHVVIVSTTINISHKMFNLLSYDFYSNSSINNLTK